MSSIVFEACGRCTGEMYLEEDSDGQYLTCLRCGHVTYPRPELDQAVGFLSDRPAVEALAPGG